MATSSPSRRRPKSNGTWPALDLTVLKALAAPLPEKPELMLCTLVAEPFDDPNWIFEPKLDGLRVWVRWDGRRLDVISRNEKSQVRQFSDIVEALRESLDDRPVVLDGEVVCLDGRGLSSFRALQQRFHLEDEREIAERARKYPAYLYVFDLVYWDRYDLRSLPLLDRKQLLRKTVRWSDRVRWTESTPKSGTKLLAEACRAAGEGIVGKHVQSTYYAGRAWEWVKIKCVGRQEFVIGGWTDPQRSRVGLGALLVGYYDESGKDLIYAGKVGTGYNAETLRDLRERMDGIGQERSPFADAKAPQGPGVHWVKPKIVAEIGFAEWTQNRLLRQPRFEGLRMDKNPTQVRCERPKSAGAASQRAKPGKGKATAGADSRAATAPPDTSLEAYRAKRDFAKTPEPKPKVGKPNPKPIFVVQEHHATRLHYDLRLEADGVLKSWAVTREPSLDPGVKRLAVQTEDHPLAYADFEGDIPAGEYGGGHMSIWDRGTFENLRVHDGRGPDITTGVREGKLEFELHGRKLKGAFAMVRMPGRGRGENWLLIKKKDRYAKPESGGGDVQWQSKALVAAGAGRPGVPRLRAETSVRRPLRRAQSTARAPRLRPTT